MMLRQWKIGFQSLQGQTFPQKNAKHAGTTFHRNVRIHYPMTQFKISEERDLQLPRWGNVNTCRMKLMLRVCQFVRGYLVPEPAHFFPRFGVINGVNEDESIPRRDGQGPHGGELEGAWRVEDVEGKWCAVLKLVFATVKFLDRLSVARQELVVQKLWDDARLAHSSGPGNDPYQNMQIHSQQYFITRSAQCAYKHAYRVGRV